MKNMILKGKKVILRPIKLSDAQRFVKWLSDSTVNKFTTKRKITLREERRWIKELSKTKRSEMVFAIDTGNGIHIGSLGLEKLDSKNRNAHLDILIGDKNYWDQGYGTDAMAALLNYAFKRLKLHRVELAAYSYNKRAIKAYKRLGFKLEGIAREETLYKGKFYDVLEMGILQKEWSKSNKRG